MILDYNLLSYRKVKSEQTFGNSNKRKISAFVNGGLAF